MSHLPTEYMWLNHLSKTYSSLLPTIMNGKNHQAGLNKMDKKYNTKLSELYNLLMNPISFNLLPQRYKHYLTPPNPPTLIY